MDIQSVAVLFGTFALLMILGVPIAYAIGLAAFATFLLFMSFDQSVYIVAQQVASGLDSFTLLAIPFFILAGNIMNRGGIAMRLIEFAKVLGGRLPGALAHCNVLANMMFGSISGSAVASAAAVGGVMAPLQKKEGYSPAFSAAVNIASCPTGLLIPPSATFIVYSLITNGTSVAALFVAGYVPGILMGLSLMVVAGIIAKRRGYPVADRATTKGSRRQDPGSDAAARPHRDRHGRHHLRCLHRDRGLGRSPSSTRCSSHWSSTGKSPSGICRHHPGKRRHHLDRAADDRLFHRHVQGDGLRRHPLFHLRYPAGPFRKPDRVAADHQPGAAGGRHLHGHDARTLDLHADLSAGRGGSRHGPGPLSASS